VRAHDPGFYHVAPEAFEAQVDLLVAAGFELVTVADLIDRRGDGPLAPGLAALTFDDGALDVFTTVRPLLAGRGLPATAYVATGHLGKPNPFLPDAAGARVMTAEELRALAAGGFELGGHTVTHPNLSELTEAECLAEMVEGKQELERLTGTAVRTFAYPFCEYGEAAVSAVRAAGFDAAVTCQGHGGDHRYELARSVITGKDGLVTFAIKLHGIYEPAFASRPGRLLRASTRGLRQSARSVLERRA